MNDFTKGPILKSLFGLAGPIVLTNLFHTAYQLVDTFWVGRLGAEAVAAVSLSFPIIFLLITLGGGFSLAGTILVAQYFGQKNTKEVNYVASQTVAMMFIISLVISVLGYWIAEPIMALMGASESVLPGATAYLRVSSLGIVFMFSFFVFQSLMRGVGEVKIPLYIVASTVFLNLILDPFFIMGFGSFEGYGVSGAAIATIITQGLASMVGLYILFRGQHGVRISLAHFKPDWQLSKKMFFLGLPASIEQSMKALGLSIMSFLVASFGTVVIASYGIGIRILTFVIIPAFGLSMATSTLVGQNMGANQVDRAEGIAKKSIQIGFTVLLALGILAYIFAPLLASTFIPDNPEVILGATIFIRYLSICFPFIGCTLICSGVFQGAGNTQVPMILSLISLWVFEFPTAYILSKHTAMGESGLWIAVPIANILAAIIAYAYFSTGRWKVIRLIKTAAMKLEDKVILETQIEEGT
jgi:putative MATE family efflux protein